MEQMEKFVDILVGARKNMEGHVTLSDTEQGFVIDELKGPADYLSAGKKYAQYWNNNMITCVVCVHY